MADTKQITGDELKATIREFLSDRHTTRPAVALLLINLEAELGKVRDEFADAGKAHKAECLTELIAGIYGARCQWNRSNLKVQHPDI